MTESQWAALTDFKAAFKQKIDEWYSHLKNAKLLAELESLQRQAADRDAVPFYSLDTPLVYNTALDDVKKTDNIRLILVGDNPGKNEQLAKNRRYLVGQSGKIAEGFFRKNAELGIDFHKNIVILNKTPLHTAKTKELSLLVKEGNPAFSQLIYDSQIWMAEKTAFLHKSMGENCSLWLVGYAELKGRGLFLAYRDALSAAYKDGLGEKLHAAGKRVFVYQHFSMNRFLIDLKEQSNTSFSLAENLNMLGTLRREEIFGW